MMSEEQAQKFHADNASLPGCSFGIGDSMENLPFTVQNSLANCQ